MGNCSMFLMVIFQIKLFNSRKALRLSSTECIHISKKQGGKRQITKWKLLAPCGDLTSFASTLPETGNCAP